MWLGFGKVSVLGFHPFRGSSVPPGPVANQPSFGMSRDGSQFASSQTLRGLNAEQKQAFLSLSPQDRSAFLATWRVADSAGGDRLARLLTTGALTKRDTKGGSLVSNLAALAAIKPPSEAPYSAQEVLDQTLKHLSDRESIHQDNRNTCTVTTVQYMVLSELPSEYVRLVAGLAGEGRVKLQSGSMLTRVADSVPRDDSSRDDVERLLQSAFMNHGFDFRGSYSNQKDGFQLENWANRADGILNGAIDDVVGSLHRLGGWFGHLSEPRVDLAKPAETMNQGNVEGRVKALYQQITGHHATLVGDLPGGVFAAPEILRGDVAGQVLAAVRRGKSVPVEISTKDLHDSPGQQEERVLPPGSVSALDIQHQILVTGIDGDHIQYRNPWGYQTWMTEREFRSRVLDGFIPN